MELSKRLEMVAGLVTQERIADIGTDHGYVPIYLYKQGRIKKAYACDVRKGPLEKCKKNIALYGAEDVIETRLGSGLTPLRPGEAETAIMALYIFCRTARRWRIALRSWCFRRSAISVRCENICIKSDLPSERSIH